MKKVMLMGVILLLNAGVNAKKEVNWSVPNGKITDVFLCSKQSRRTELVRLYDSGEYEHLLFEEKAGGKEYVQRNLGAFDVQRMKITFGVPSFKSFTGKFKYGIFYRNQDLFIKWFDARLKRENSMSWEATADPRYRKPFFLSLERDVIVSNREAAEEVDFGVLVDYLTGDSETDSAKVAHLEEFIVRSIEYDHVGFETGQLANDPYDVFSILAGTQRTAVCSGYSNTLIYLCELAGIEIHEVPGFTRSSFSELSKLKGYHVWNRILIDGNYELHDITWADLGEYLDPAWVNVAPEVLILSHFPDNQQDQFLDKPIHQSEFLGTACVFPLAKDAVLKHAPLASHVFAEKELTLQFSKDTRVAIYKLDDDVLFEPQPFEDPGTIRKQILFPVSNYTTTQLGDSSVYTLGLRSFLNVFYVEVDESYLMMFVAVNGNQEDLFRYYAENADNEHYEKYVKGLLAAIKLKDYDLLKTLAGKDNEFFFDKKGNFKMDRSFLETIEMWDGSISELYEQENISNEKDVEGGLVQKMWSSYIVEIPSGLKFTLDMVEGKYSIASIE